ELHLISFSEIAIPFLKNMGYEPYLCKDENEARSLIKTLPETGEWPCLFTLSDTTGEKSFEEFYTDNEKLDMHSFNNIGVIKNELIEDDDKLDFFENMILKLKATNNWNKSDLIKLFKKMIPNFLHIEKGKSLDSKM
ncbi:MAG: UDP-N-acetylglucosamine 4,6-dehydratase, partial [Flavobacteriaceae bacterium]|nr:UDP-N-acetylglucosamine 4,6-dehydratase [Flavobacteriaceae bacterium]